MLPSSACGRGCAGRPKSAWQRPQSRHAGIYWPPARSCRNTEGDPRRCDCRKKTHDRMLRGREALRPSSLIVRHSQSACDVPLPCDGPIRSALSWRPSEHENHECYCAFVGAAETYVSSVISPAVFHSLMNSPCMAETKRGLPGPGQSSSRWSSSTSNHTKYKNYARETIPAPKKTKKSLASPNALCYHRTQGVATGSVDNLWATKTCELRCAFFLSSASLSLVSTLLIIAAALSNSLC